MMRHGNRERHDAHQTPAIASSRFGCFAALAGSVRLSISIQSNQAMKSDVDSSMPRVIEPAPWPAFEPHPLAASHPFDTLRPPEQGELMLWLLRSEWQLISREAGHLRLSPAELKRARTHPHAALGKRFAVSRAVLRGLLAPMTGEAPERIELLDGPDGRVRLAKHGPASALDVVVDYAGIWILIGIASCSLGIATQALLPTGYAPSTVRAATRRAALAMATGRPAAIDAALLEYGGPALWVELPPTGTWHLLDIPMPGKLRGAISAAAQIRRVAAFGWRPSPALATGALMH
jgi:hypothetical protein